MEIKNFARKIFQIRAKTLAAFFACLGAATIMAGSFLTDGFNNEKDVALAYTNFDICAVTGDPCDWGDKGKSACDKGGNILSCESVDGSYKWKVKTSADNNNICRVSDSNPNYIPCAEAKAECGEKWGSQTSEMTIENYCSQCPGSDDCKCRGLSEGTFIEVNYPVCGAAGTIDENISYVCESSSKGLKAEPCLNGYCQNGECKEHSTRKNVNEAIVNMVTEINNGTINTSKYNNFEKLILAAAAASEKDDNYDSKISGNTSIKNWAMILNGKGFQLKFLNAAAPLFKNTGIKVEDVACPNARATWCREADYSGAKIGLARNQIYTYRCVKQSGYFVWNWVTSFNPENCQYSTTIGGMEYYCDYSSLVENGQFTDKAKSRKEISSTKCSAGAEPDLPETVPGEDEADIACYTNNDCQQRFGADYYCLYKGLGGEIGFCGNEGGCYSPSNGKNFNKGVIVCGGNGTSQYCETPTNPPSTSGWERTPNENCPEDGGICDRDTGLCTGGSAEEQTAELTCSDGLVCENTPDCVAACGDEWTCQTSNTDSISINVGGKTYTFFNLPDFIKLKYGSYRGVCVPPEKEETVSTDCKLGNIMKGTPTFSYTGCDGAYVKFILNHSGDCSETDIYCEVSDDYNNGTTEAEKKSNILSTTTSSNWSACIPIASRYDDSGGGSSNADIPSNINFKVECTTSDGQSLSENIPCDNPFRQEDEQQREEEQKSEEGEACEGDDDCQSGLVCVDGECVTEEDAQELEEQNNTAPQVTISSPSGTIETQTAELKVSTDIAATCKYMLARDGWFNDFNGGGMTMGGSGGTTHTATLSNLTDIEASNCLYNHTVTVMCKNSEASADASAAVGAAQTNFSVDLSNDEKYAPVVSSATDGGDFSIANPVLEAVTDRPATCQYKEGSSFTYGSGKPFDATGSYNHNAQLQGLENGDHTYYVVCQDQQTCAANDSGTEINFTVDLSANPEFAPMITSTTPDVQTVANPVLSVTTDRPATCQYKQDYTFDYGGGTPFTNDGDYAHSVSLADMDDDTYTFYVACEDNATGAPVTLETAVTTTLDRGRGAPIIASTTPDIQTVDNPELSVTTDRPATCQYKEGSSFTYGSGLSLDTGDKYSHKVSLADLDDDTYTFYVACKSDVEKGAAMTLESPIVTALERGEEGWITITNTTLNNQTTNAPTISVSTNIAAVCQYKKDADFTFGAGMPFAVTGATDHNVQLSDISDGTYAYYVVCQNPETKETTSPGTQIVFTVNISANAPVIYNTTPASQKTGSPTLSVITNMAATCQYKQDAAFDYGEGVQFTVDGGTGHSAVFDAASDGTYVFYVVCQDPATGATSSGAQIIFTVSTSSETCAELSSNDKQNDSDRVYDYDDADSEYLWRSVENGTREKFTEVDWYAGYQFSVEEDGFVNRLCGYFEYGQTNRVSLYNGYYDEIAYADVEGEDGWNCVSISPAQVKADKRYYVIARVQNAPIYFEYKSGLLPRGGDNATVESGIRQIADDDFGNDVKKYDYMVFGLVDVMIKFTDENTDGPEIISVQPDDETTDSDTKLELETDVVAACKFDREDVSYDDMEYTFEKTGQTHHEQKICDLDDGIFTWFARCEGDDGANNASTMIHFEVED